MDQNDELASLKESIRIFERLTAAAWQSSGRS